MGTDSILTTIGEIDSGDSIEVIKWVANCSDSSTSIEKCKEYTDNLLSALESISSSGRNDLDTGSLSFYIRTVFMNRGNDTEFLDMLWNYNIRVLDLSAVNSIYQMSGNEAGSAKIEEWMNKYIKRHGEDKEILYLQLKWYTLPFNYSKNSDKVKEIMQKVN